LINVLDWTAEIFGIFGNPVVWKTGEEWENFKKYKKKKKNGTLTFWPSM